MATLLELEGRGFLVRYDPELGVQVLEQRLVYISSSAMKWLEEKLPRLESRWTSMSSPYEQVDALLADFCSGENLTHVRQFHVMNPRSQGVWELKTADVRLFGWFVAKDCFVLAACDSAHKLKSVKPNQLDIYARNVAHVVGFRATLQLDEPKFLKGEDPDGVVSTFS